MLNMTSMQRISAVVLRDTDAVHCSVRHAAHRTLTDVSKISLRCSIDGGWWFGASNPTPAAGKTEVDAFLDR